MKNFTLLASFVFLFLTSTNAQNGYWQQAVNYEINVDFNVENHQFDGVQTVTYTNNSPDTLTEVFFHLYFNAFQPGSAMDTRSLTIKDPDGRVKDRISKLKDDEIGYHNINAFTQDRDSVTFQIVGTVLEASLPTPIAPGEQTKFYLSYHSQVPLQIRRSGRDNKEGIDYTMTQWYPKLAEYDQSGWNVDTYIGREFYGVWGTFDVTIDIDKSYTLAGTGVVQNPQEVGHGYQDPDEILVPSKDSDKISWHFKAENVHDFAWAADPDYQHDMYYAPGGPKLHFFYQTDTLAEQWKAIQPKVGELFQVMNALFGKYPYSDFSVIQGGDGGMEYPMCTMILGHGDFDGQLGLIAHESFHNWYYGVLGTNEGKYPWMDEGFTSYAEHIVMDSVTGKHEANPLGSYYYVYGAFSATPLHEPMSVHADRFKTNRAYSISSYVKGSIFLYQLNYIVGEDVFYRGMKRYFNTWKFKHPDPWDFIRVMEKESGLVLDWYLERFVNTTEVTDYAIASVDKAKKQTEVTLKRIGNIPMPLDIKVSYTDGTEELFYIPLEMMRGEKANETKLKRTVLKDWVWVAPTYTFTLDKKVKEVASIQIDPSGRLADIDLENNSYSNTK